MPRRQRLYLPDQPQHVVVRGHNRDPILARHEDFRFLYQCLYEGAVKHELAIHAWVLMNNHLHLLATPSSESSLPKTMQSLGRRYAQYFNRTYHRSGSLWEGRYKSSLVDTDRYLLSCYRYIELNSVRAGIAKRPEDYPYSSYHANGLGKSDKLVTPHSIFCDFIGLAGNVSESKRPDSDTGVVGSVSASKETNLDTRGCYRELCKEMLDRKTLTEIRRGTEKGLGIGQAEFLLKVARLGSGR
ncbi:MAG: transposase [Chromatiales bacterium]|nr:transposase [Chromatiales bacterium]